MLAPLLRGKLIERCLYGVLTINLLMLAFYLVIDYQLVFHSDSAVKNLLAQEIADTGQYFPRDWNYVNGDLWVFNTHTFILPLLRWMHNGYLMHAASDLISAALILYGSWLLTGLLEQSRLARLLGMLVISAGMSLMMAEHIYGQAAYGSLYYMACFLMLAYWSLSQARGGKLLLWGGATAMLTTLVFWTNPQRALLYYGLPLLAAGAVQQALEWRAARQAQRPVDWRQALAMGVVVLGLIVGTGLNQYILSGVNNHQGVTDMRWLDFNGMARNLLAVISGVMSLFDGIPNSQGKVASLAGAYAALRVVGALLLILMLPWGAYKALQLQRGPRQLVVVFALISFATSLFIMVATSLADMSAPESSVRYLVPSLLYLLLIFTGLMLDRRAAAPLPRAAGIAALLLLATSAPSSYLYPFNESIHMPRRGLILKTPDQQLADFLREQGLRYGYATFWNAGKVTVLGGGSASGVRVRPVELAQGLPQPVRTLSSNRWYGPAAWQGESFLLLRDSEMAGLNLPMLASYAGQPRMLRFGDANILVYPRNLAAVLPDWDVAVQTPVHYRMDERTLHQRGVIENGAVVTQAGEEGNLHFGPMRMLSRGAYAVSFELDTSGGEHGDYGMIDVVSQAGTLVLARQQVTAAGPQRLTLRFDTAIPLDRVEFRAFSYGRGRFALRGIDVERIPTALEKK